jgi:hypothetical protein
LYALLDITASRLSYVAVLLATDNNNNNIIINNKHFNILFYVTFFNISIEFADNELPRDSQFFFSMERLPLVKQLIM